MLKDRAVTKSKLDNFYLYRESIIGGIKIATDAMIAGKTAVVAACGDAGKGCAGAFVHSVPVSLSPRLAQLISTLQAAVSGFRVTAMEEAVPWAKIVTCADCTDILTAGRFEVMKDNATSYSIAVLPPKFASPLVANISTTLVIRL